MNMNKVSSIILFLVIAFTTISCNDDKTKGENWGHTEYYKSYWFNKYEPIIMTRTLELELNNDAARFFNDKNAYIEMCVSSNPDKFVEPEDIKVYFNHQLCEDFKFKLYPKEQLGKEDETLNKGEYAITGDLGIEFESSMAEGEHTFYLLYLSCNGKNILKLKDSDDWLNTNSKDLTYAYGGSISSGIYATKEEIMNPAVKMTLIILGTLLGFYLIWLLILRPLFYHHFRQKEFIIRYPSSNEDRYVNIKGFCSLILTDCDIKQGFIKKMFKTCDAVEVNKVWTSKVVITPKGRNDLKITGDVRCSTDDPVFGEKFKIKTYEGAEVTFE